jgi:membrane protein
MRASDEIWGLEPRKGLAIIRFLRTRLYSFGLVLVLAFLLLVSLALSAALAVLERYAAGLATYTILTALSSALSFAVITCLFAVIYKVLPDAPISWRDVWIGAAFTAGLFTLGKYAIGLYLGNSAVASSFGAAGSVIRCCYGFTTLRRSSSSARSARDNTRSGPAACARARPWKRT